MTPFSGDEFWEPRPAPPVRAEEKSRRSYQPRRPQATRTWYRPSPGTPYSCGCARKA